MTTDSSSAAPADLEATLARIRELNERFLETNRRSGRIYLDVYEKTLRGLMDFQAATAELGDDERAKKMARAYADFTNEVTSAYVAASRELLR